MPRVENGIELDKVQKIINDIYRKVVEVTCHRLKQSHNFEVHLSA